MIIAIGSGTQTTLKFDDIVESLLAEEMRWKTMDSWRTYALFVRGYKKYINKISIYRGDLNLKENIYGDDGNMVKTMFIRRIVELKILIIRMDLMILLSSW